jgi:hypothetical protein
MLDRRSLLLGGMALSALPRGRAAAPRGALAQTRRPSRIELRIRFMTQRDGQSVQRGEESASYDFHDDGLIAFRASSHSDSPRISRDVIYTLDRGFRPLEAFVRLQVEGQYEGSGWFRFESGQVSSETSNRRAGRESQVMRIDAPARAFIAHPVTTDVMLAAAYERGGPKRQRLPGTYTSSADPYGRVGPSLAPSTVFLEYVGTERVNTPAGIVQADRYELFTEETATEPLESLWTLADTAVFVRAQARGQFNTVYELVEFKLDE